MLLIQNLFCEKLNFQNWPTHKTSRGASFALYFRGSEVKVWCNILHHWSQLPEEFNKFGESKWVHSKDSLSQQVQLEWYNWILKEASYINEQTFIY